ncbi:MAG TPA: hypothetical protein VH877_26110 [Polyangia bacterium]|jgi:hypothetical protein|nr:hypothetical protein [Polyangia bacterium]
MSSHAARKLEISSFFFGLSLFAIQLVLPMMGYQESLPGAIFMLLFATLCLLMPIWLLQFETFNVRSWVRVLASTIVIIGGIALFRFSPLYMHATTGNMPTATMITATDMGVSPISQKSALHDADMGVSIKDIYKESEAPKAVNHSASNKSTHQYKSERTNQRRSERPSQPSIIYQQNNDHATGIQNLHINELPIELNQWSYREYDMGEQQLVMLEIRSSNLKVDGIGIATQWSAPVEGSGWFRHDPPGRPRLGYGGEATQHFELSENRWPGPADNLVRHWSDAWVDSRNSLYLQYKYNGVRPVLERVTVIDRNGELLGVAKKVDE